MAPTPPGAVRYDSTRLLPPHLTLANTSSAKLLLSHPAQSSRGVLFFFSCCLAAASGASLAPVSPSWGSRNGELWVHWGDPIALLTPGKPTMGYSIEPFISRRTAWAGADIYVDMPEALWVGIDGKGRDFIRLSFDELKKRSKPWR